MGFKTFLLVGMFAVLVFFTFHIGAAQATTIRCYTNNNSCQGVFEHTPTGCSVVGNSTTACGNIPLSTALAGQNCTDDGQGHLSCTVPDSVQQPEGLVTKITKDTGNSTGSVLGFYVAQIIYVFTVGLGSILAYVGSFLLNLAISFSLDSSAYNLDFISTGWTLLRDVANMAFIFILIYIAIQVMFQAQTHGTVERLVKVLAVALVINFSFFATRVVIDAGNLVSVQFYNAITANAPTADVNLTAVANSGLHVPDITAKIMQGVNFQSAISTDSFKNNTGNDGLDFGASFISFAFIYIALGAMLFMLAAAFIAAGVKFLVRIVMLWFSIITAPLALVMWAFQSGHGDHGGGGGHGHSFSFASWLKNLINHAFYPAVFLFVMLLISNFMGGTGDFGGGFIQQSVASLQGNTQGVPGLAAIVANIAVRLGFVLVMLYFALKASDYFEVAYSGVATQIGNTLSLGGLAGYRRGLGWVGGVTGRTASTAISRPVGALGYNLDKKIRESEFGRSALGGAVRDRITKPLSNASIAGEKSFTAARDAQKARDKEYAAASRDKENHDLIHAIEANGGVADAAQEKRIKNLGKRELEHMSNAEIETITNYLSDDQKKTLHNAENLTDAQKEAMEAKWHENAGSAPLQKAEGLADELQTVNSKLGDIKYVINNQTYKLSDLLKSGAKINKTKLNDIREAFSQKLDAAKTQREAGQAMLSDAVRRKNVSDANLAKQMLSGAQAIERNASEALKKVEKLAEETVKIPANASTGRPTKGEFTKK